MIRKNFVLQIPGEITLEMFQNKKKKGGGSFGLSSSDTKIKESLAAV